MSYDTPSPETEAGASAGAGADTDTGTAAGDALDQKIDEHGAPTDDALPETEPTDPNPLVENDG